MHTTLAMWGRRKEEREERGWRRQGSKEGEGRRQVRRGKGRGRNSLYRNAFFNSSFSALKATEDSIPWHPHLQEGSTGWRTSFKLQVVHQNPHSRSMCLPSQPSLVSNTELITSHQVVLFNVCASESHYIISWFRDYLLLYLSSSYIPVKLSSAETQTPRDCHSLQQVLPLHKHNATSYNIYSMYWGRYI